MRLKIAVLLLMVLGAMLAPLAGAAPAQAQQPRTWISGLGDDANPCIRTAPCKTWTGAMAKTAAGGEIGALDSGGFGGVTIRKAITLDGGAGQIGSVLVSGTNGIVVAAGASDVVILRNLRIGGVSGGGTNGIQFTSGLQLVVDHVDVSGFSNNGLDVALTASGNVLVRNATFYNNAANGISVTTTAGVAVAQISNSSFAYKGNASGNGVTAAGNGVVMVSNSVFDGFDAATQATGNGNLSVAGSLITNSKTGVGSAAGTTVNVTNNTLINNTNAFTVAGTFNSAKDNKIAGATDTPNGAMTIK